MLLTPGKIALYSAYLFIGAYLAFWLPWKNMQFLFGNAAIIRNTPSPINIKALHWLAGLLGIAAFTLIPWWYIFASLLIAAAIQYKNQLHDRYSGSCVFIGLIFASFLPWWLHNNKNRLELTPSQTLIFLSVTSLAFLLFVNSQRLTQLNSNWMRRLIDICFVTALLAIYSASINISLSTPDFAQWHHWGHTLGQPS